MIDRAALLADLKPLVRRLEDDLRERCEEQPEVGERLRAEWQAARDAGRTKDAFKVWRDGKGNLSGRLTEVAAAWVLATVFVRFLEDNELIAPPRLSGPGDRLELAADVRSAYFRENPLHNDRNYLEHVLLELAELPALTDLFGDLHNPLWTVGLSADGAKELIQFWHQRDEASGDVLHDFRDDRTDGGGWDTRFLGDLYQDLSEAAKKRFALLQTPDFVEEFILDRTLTPACEEFGYREVRLIDPACGSGHFLLGAFERLLRRWMTDEPATNPAVLAQKVLDQVAGVDLNPFAVAIARFRLLLAALAAANVKRLTDAPAFHPRVAAGDSLLHGPAPGDGGGRQHALGELVDDAWRGDEHLYATEDGDALAEILGRRYHAVVGNPPYITVKDKAQNAAIRDRYGSCHRQYALSVPFMERLFDLAIAPASGESAPAGYVGQITSNSFMKREFGKRLIQEFVPKWDLTHVIDMSGAYVPGHGTPTVILIGRHRRPTSEQVRAVLGIRGEPSTPDEPADGRVWTAIRAQIDRPGSESEFVSVEDVPRMRFEGHPWSLQGGGAHELLEAIEAASDMRLGSVATEIGFAALTREDEVYRISAGAARRVGIDSRFVLPFVAGEEVRDWFLVDPTAAIWPYDEVSLTAKETEPVSRFLWPWRTQLADRVAYGKTQLERGLTWFEYSMFFEKRFRTPLSITFAFVATHNHFVLDRGGKVFKQSAPVIKLPPEATEDDHLALLGLLNSSVACFWLQQVCHNKGGPGGARSKDEKWHDFYELNGKSVSTVPVPASLELTLVGPLDELATRQVGPRDTVRHDELPLLVGLGSAKERSELQRRRMIALQEELDWQYYAAFGLCDPSLAPGSPDVPGIELGQRAFEIVLARKKASGEVETRWFERHGSTPITEIPSHWPADYRDLVQRRIDEIARNKSIRLIEKPEYKRRWNTEPWEERQERALRTWLLDRLESPAYWPDVRLQSVAALADRARADARFLEVTEVFTGMSAPDPVKLVSKLVRDESVPFLAAHRYKPAGLRKRARWEETWELQRAEDRIDARTELPKEHPRHLTPEQAKALKAEEVGEIPVPPKYASGDFVKSSYWRQRGKLDVPKERFISYPGAEREADPTLVLGWAGWDHLERTQALVAYYQERRERESWPPERFVPLLAGVQEQVPWLLQWHNEQGEFDQGAGDDYAAFVAEQARSLGRDVEDVAAWRPPKTGRGRKRKAR